jgi:protein phosphatase
MGDEASPEVQGASVRLLFGPVTVDLDWAAATHAGSLRPTNQDAYRVNRGAFVVCDGMGGHRGGERASEVVADCVAGAWASGTWPSVADIVRSVGVANALVLQESDVDPAVAGMGTTVVALVAADHGGHPVLVALSVGDSRIYARTGDTVVQMSHDHSVVQELIDAGTITTEEAVTHRERHVVTRVVGSEFLPDPDFWVLALAPGARYLLCTDGVHGEIAEYTVRDLLRRGAPADVVAALAQEALDVGGRDNLTALVVSVAAVSGLESMSLGDDTAPRVPRAAPPRTAVRSGAGTVRESPASAAPLPLIVDVPRAD